MNENKAERNCSIEIYDSEQDYRLVIGHNPSDSVLNDYVMVVVCDQS